MDKNINISIVCCLWGRWPKPIVELSLYTGIEYVNRLYRAVERNVTLPHRFFCFTDTFKNDYQNFDKGIIVQLIKTPSRLREIAKLYVYKSGIGLTGRIMVVDLDTVIFKNIDEFLIRREEFIVRKAFNPKYIKKFDGIGGDLISFNVGFGEFIWEALSKRTSWINKKTKGDERAAYKLLLPRTEITFWQDILPDRYFSFKKHFRKARGEMEKQSVLDKASLMSFHGLPRPHQLIGQFNWIKDNWK